MKKNKLLWFILKATIYYVLLTLPFQFMEKGYREFYMGTGRIFFKKIHTTGFVRFQTDPNPVIAHLQVGNLAVPESDGTYWAAMTDVNTRIRGYLLIALYAALTLALPQKVFWKLKHLFYGLILVSVFVMFKQWIHLLYVYNMNPRLNLYSFNSFQKKVINFGYENLITTVGPSLCVVLLIWFIVTLGKGGMLQIPGIAKAEDSKM